jgi:hypothetical protein
MYHYDNLAHFLDNGGGKELSSDTKAGIFDRACEIMGEYLMILGGSTENILARDSRFITKAEREIIDSFENELSSDMQQLRILGNLAGEIAKQQGP